jgi:hypothetical protein
MEGVMPPVKSVGIEPFARERLRLIEKRLTTSGTSQQLGFFAQLKTAWWTKIGDQRARSRQLCTGREELPSGERTQRLQPCLTSAFTSARWAFLKNAQREWHCQDAESTYVPCARN